MFFIISEAAYYDGYSQKAFLDEVRRGLKKVKNRHNKNEFRNRQLQRQEQEQAIEGEDEEEDEVHLADMEELGILPEDFIKQEEILCD